MQFIQLPDLGTDLSHDGKMAKRVNGKARARAKPNIPTAGAMMLPDVPASTSRNPIIGPVHEKLTKTKVNAMRKMLSSPEVEDAFLSTALFQEDGRVISKPPRKEAPKTMSIRKKKMLKMALVDMALSADAPKIAVTASPRARYITMIDTPYIIAALFPPPFFRKKLTVIGMIGHTQGVSRARSPPRKPRRKTTPNPCPSPVMEKGVFSVEGLEFSGESLVFRVEGLEFRVAVSFEESMLSSFPLTGEGDISSTILSFFFSALDVEGRVTVPL